MWFKVDDHLHEHGKLRRIDFDLAAVGLWTLAGSWVGMSRTDGFVPESVLRRWSSRWRKPVGLLVEAGLWEPCEVGGERGWRFHDWAQWAEGGAVVGPFQTEPVSARLRLLILERDQYRCQRCGAGREDAQLEIDHVHPRSKGGTNDPSNLQVLCLTCNARKGAR
jgi:hypothetical protein